MGVIPLWVWCAAVYAVLLAWPLKQLWWRRRVLRDGSAITSIGQRWAHRSANGVIVGEGTIRINGCELRRTRVSTTTWGRSK
jgi:hypothetical protein